jgi:transcriptional regulator with XRE-family HTH domain
MTPEDFKAWRKAMGFRSQQAAADALGMSKSAIVNYELGTRRDGGKPVEIPRVVALACAALDAGLDAWTSDALLAAQIDIAMERMEARKADATANKKPA